MSVAFAWAVTGSPSTDSVELRVAARSCQRSTARTAAACSSISVEPPSSSVRAITSSRSTVAASRSISLSAAVRSCVISGESDRSIADSSRSFIPVSGVRS